MTSVRAATAVLLITLFTSSCATYSAWQKAAQAEKAKDWDQAVVQYEKALEVAPENTKFKIGLQRAKLEASRVHFARAKSLSAAAAKAQGDEQLKLAHQAATELEITVKLDPTNQFAAVEHGKIVQLILEITARNNGPTIDEVKRRAKNVTKAQPPALNPASDVPISLSFPRETAVKEIYRALGNAFGINILFDQAVKDDRIAIELRDVTAQQALERVMQAANHFYKVLDEKTLIVVPDNPQARRDYEDLVIQTFYLSNGDAEQVTNVVRTMIEARNVFPLKALNAITIRDTADKVRIAEKIIEANDKAKSEVVVDVELIEMDLNKTQDIGAYIAGTSGVFGASSVDDKGVRTALGSVTLGDIRGYNNGRTNRLGLNESNWSFTMPTLSYNLLKSMSNTEVLANPELRISEGEKATLHIGQRIPVPVSTFTSVNTGSTGGTFSPVTSFQYQDVGIKVSMEPRVHHNREVTLKLTVEVSNQGNPVIVQGQPPQPTFLTRTIESTIRLKDGETNFLAGLIQQTTEEGNNKTPFLGDIPILGRFFTMNHKGLVRTDLVLTMTPHIIRIPDITDDDVAPMWVGTTNNLTFRGVSPRIESQSGVDPFNTPRPADQFTTTAPQPGADGATRTMSSPQLVTPAQGSAPGDPFRPPPAPVPVPPTPNPPSPQSNLQPDGNSTQVATLTASSDTALRLSPRLGPQPANLSVRPGEQKLWTVVGMDLEGLTVHELLFHYDPVTLDVAEVLFGPAMAIDPRTPPVATINRETGTIRIRSSNDQPMAFAGGGEVIGLRVAGLLSGETFLVLENPDLRDKAGKSVSGAITGGRAQVQ